MSAAQTDLGFTYRATAQGVVHISRAGREVVTLRAPIEALMDRRGASRRGSCDRRSPVPRAVAVLLIAYGTASLLHFIHNAEFLADYPNMPAWISRANVYLAWLGLTAVGLGGWLLLRRGYPLTGFMFVAVYAALGMDSLGHYVLAPMSAHTAAMNATILLEVITAALLFTETARQIAGATWRRMLVRWTS